MPITHEIAWLRLLHGRTHRGPWRESAPSAAPLAGRVDGSPESLRRPPLTHPTGAGDTVMKRIGNKDGNLKARTNVTCHSPRIWCNPYFSLCVLMIQESLSQLIFSQSLGAYFLSLHTHEVHICYFSDSLLVCKKNVHHQVCGRYAAFSATGSAAACKSAPTFTKVKDLFRSRECKTGCVRNQFGWEKLQPVGVLLLCGKLPPFLQCCHPHPNLWCHLPRAPLRSKKHLLGASHFMPSQQTLERLLPDTREPPLFAC